ncbi:OmpA family protein [Psychromonas antarctica]|jgi:chemotaxis protein MotB|uniref:OmpA family protein n=1 Tax=Psychromonas antarctica TaxID=67573 RepID=UPI001EE81BEB|nr:OmpA family protein [Psychromonas antarctica]MCG6199822.1 OmpA family protein [Psychromonas antarctica]
MRVRPRSRLQMHSGNDINRWTISLADFMTLMFAVFVVLYAVTLSHEEKYKDVIMSIQNASKLLNQSVLSSHREGILNKESNSIIEDVTGPAILSDGALNQADNELSDVDSLKFGGDLNELKVELESSFASELDNELVKLNLDGDWLTIEMGGQLLFAGGSHTLLTSAVEQLAKLAKVLKSVNNMLRIRGYTDQRAISNEIYSSNWELSAARAFSVLHALTDFDIKAQRMVVEAYGEYYPVIDVKGYVDNLKSRRVVIAISKYALVDKAIKNSIAVDKENQKIQTQLPALVKPDSEQMQELHLPNNRLIITTRQE